jgi:arsenate reductase-like glutaredoxin family protein
VVHVKLGKNRPDDDELTAMMLGPTGNLRAPTLRCGKKVVVGFNADVYGEVLG